jgi:cyclopropane fatty-acyl-phospholipid synthase-like methyltransferase
MWAGGESWYFYAGEGGLIAILLGLAHSRLENVRTILDLPCGHGRVARHLRAGFPDSQISYCDLNRSGVRFCVKTFGGTGIYSHPNLLKTPLETYDIIWVGSLFTHVNQERTSTWLPHLCYHLNENGILLATFHGRWSIESQKQYPIVSDALFQNADEVWSNIVEQFEREGYGFAPFDWINDNSYGMSLSSPSKLMEIASEIQGVRILSYTERGWSDNHDVLVIGRTDRLKPWS